MTQYFLFKKVKIKKIYHYMNNKTNYIKLITNDPKHKILFIFENHFKKMNELDIKQNEFYEIAGIYINGSKSKYMSVHCIKQIINVNSTNESMWWDWLWEGECNDVVWKDI